MDWVWSAQLMSRNTYLEDTCIQRYFIYWMSWFQYIFIYLFHLGVFLAVRCRCGQSFFLGSGPQSSAVGWSNWAVTGSHRCWRHYDVLRTAGAQSNDFKSFQGCQLIFFTQILIISYIPWPVGLDCITWFAWEVVLMVTNPTGKGI